jgi:cytochrome c6
MYGKKCLACHGLDGAGDKPLGRKTGAPDLRRTTLSQDEIEAVIAQGRGKMMGYKDRITAEQIRAIAGYVKASLARPPAPR